MVSPDALPIVLDQDTMRPAVAGLGPAIALERGEDAGSFGHVAGRVLHVIIPTIASANDPGSAPSFFQMACCMIERQAVQSGANSLSHMRYSRPDIDEWAGAGSNCQHAP
jgi:hypothetical protein